MAVGDFGASRRRGGKDRAGGNQRPRYCLPRKGHGGAGQVAACANVPGPSSLPGPLLGGRACAVQDARGGADVHVKRDAVVGVPGHPGHVGGVELPGEQRRGAEHVPQRVPSPRAIAVRIAPADRQVGGGKDAPVEVGGAPVRALGRGEDQTQGIGPSVLLRAGLPDTGGQAFGERVAGRRAAG